MNKEEINLGSDYSDVSIFPRIFEIATTNIVKQQEAYVLQKIMEVNIDPNTLRNQLREIQRLNEVIGQLEKALDKACDELSWLDDMYGLYLEAYIRFTNDYLSDRDRHKPKTLEEWKEWCLKND